MLPFFRFPSNDDEDDDDDDDEVEIDRRMNSRFITQRRGNSSHLPSSHAPTNSTLMDDDDEDDDETLMLNMRRQVKTQATALEQPEKLQFDVNELLQLTPLKPLLNMNGKTNNGPPAIGHYSEADEATATIQLTQRFVCLKSKILNQMNQCCIIGE